MRFLTWALILLTFCLILLGGVVHTTDSSLACPDWPTCYGSLMPEMKGNVAVEHGHRLLASAVGFLTIILTILLWKKERPLRWLGLAALGLVIFQGILGGITVLYQLPDPVSTAHLGTSMLFFAVLIVIAARSSGVGGSSTGGPPPARPHCRGMAARQDPPQLLYLTITLLYLQILLGAYVRHAGAGLLCPDIPFCYGEAWPEFWSRQLHMAHRYGGVLVFLLLVFLPIPYWKFSSMRQRFLLTLLPTLGFFQIVLGIFAVKTLLGLPVATAHLGVAALLMGLLVNLTADFSCNRRVTAGLPSLKDLITLTKPRVTLLVVLTTACGLRMAPTPPAISIILLTLIGTSLMVAAANTLNMYLEREIDALMRRTQERPLPAKRLPPRLALCLGIGLAIIATFLLYQVNRITAILGVSAFLSYVLFYTPLKQKSMTALLVGAAPGAMPPLMGWTAATDSISLPGIVLFFILFLWQIPHFLAISLVYQEEYEKAGIRVLPLERGEKETRHWMFRYAIGLLAVSLYPFAIGQTGRAYFIIALLLGSLFLGLGGLGLRQNAGLKWARSFFFASIIYLPLLLISLVAGKI
ncbi:MAG: protoheme IX farnesyltransferase [Deltaproteobacteria bacterium]|nr:protoheme IX farnesyltransferase [Deltaproteobacteria bacterium]